MHFRHLFVTCFIFTYCACLDFVYDEAGVLSEKPQRKRNVDQNSVLHIWKYNGEQMHAYKLWKTVQIDIRFDQDADVDYSIYQSANKSEILRAYNENRRFVTNFLRKWSSTWRPSSYLAPFNSVYVGVEADSSYTIKLKYKNIDYSLALLFIGGVALFFLAKRLSRSAIAFYAGGTTLGVVGSLLIVVFVLYRLAPKRSMAVSVLLGGWSFVAYISYMIWRNFYLLLSEYYRYAAVYLVSIAVVSFAVSYVRGPPRGKRTLNLIQWLLQALGLVMIYYACQIPALAIAAIVFLVFVANIPAFVIRRFSLLWLRYFPQRRRLLTEEEYISEGARETQRALEELRKYCQSPDCNAWRTVSRLNSPQQFADFVAGRRHHISDDELLRHGYGNEMDDQHESDDDETDSDDGTSSTSDHVNESPHSHRRSIFYESFNGQSSASIPETTRKNGRYWSRGNRSLNGDT